MSGIPITLDTQTVVGRVAAGSGDAEAVPFATLAAQLGMAAPRGTARNGQGTIGVSSAAIGTYTADELVVKNVSGNPMLLSSVSVSVSLATSGANGLDTGTEASTTWYYLYVIAKSDGTVAGLWSASATQPTLPSGYTYLALVAAGYNDGSSNLLAAYVRGKGVYYKAAQNALNAGSATSTTAITITALVPAIAATFRAQIRTFGVTADGSGVVNANTNIEVVSGSLYRKGAVIQMQGLANSQAAVIGGIEFLCPNISQTLRYYATVTTGSSPQTTIDITSFEMP